MGSKASTSVASNGEENVCRSSPSTITADNVQCTYQSLGNPAHKGVPRPLSHVLRQFVSVLDFGTKGDGVTDCTAAIQRAIDVAAGHTIHFPAGAYVVTKSLRVTNHSAGGSRFAGELTGYFEWSKNSDGSARASTPGSCIVGRTGSAPVFDCAGSQFLEFKSLSIQSQAGDSNYSTCGLFVARTKASEYCQCVLFLHESLFPSGQS